MKSRLVLSLAFTFAVLTLARADEVFVRGKDKAIIGTIKTEDAKGVVINTAGPDKKKVDEFIPASDVLDTNYTDIKPVKLVLSDGAYKLARNAEKDALESPDPAKRKSSLGLAISRYTEATAGVQGPIYAKRIMEYKIATLMLRQAQTEQQPIDKAIARLHAFKTAYPNSWQVVHVMPLLAQTQLDVKDYKGAAATFEEMAGMDALPAETRLGAELEVVRVLVKADELDKAQKKLDQMASRAATNPAMGARVKMAKAELLMGQKKTDEALPILVQVVKDTNDKNVKAVAHNTIGECYYRANRYNEALWEFLWVDAVFNQDKAQHAKALYYLWRTFEQLNNAERAQECREMLLNDKQFSGTEYQLRGAKEAR